MQLLERQAVVLEFWRRTLSKNTNCRKMCSHNNLPHAVFLFAMLFGLGKKEWINIAFTTAYGILCAWLAVQSPSIQKIFSAQEYILSFKPQTTSGTGNSCPQLVSALYSCVSLPCTLLHRQVRISERTVLRKGTSSTWKQHWATKKWDFTLWAASGLHLSLLNS